MAARESLVRIVATSSVALLGAALGLTATGPVTPPAAADQHREPIVERLSPDHPRLLATDADFAALRTRVESDPTSGRWYEQLRQDGTRILAEPPSEYEIPDGLRLLATSRQVLSRVQTLALLYQLDDDDRWAERAWDELEAAAGFPDWNPRHFLDTAEMTHAFAIGYDWLYHYWSPERRETLRDAIVTMGLTPALAAYRRDGSTDAAIWWVTSPSNWNIVCNGGIGMGALAIGDEVPEIAEEILQSGLDSLPTAVAAYAPDGAYPEGVGSYWAYATRYLVPYIASLETAVGDDFGLSEAPGLSTTGDFPIYLTGPTGQNFNYYDAGSGSPQPPEMFWLANAYDRPVYTWWGRQGAEADADPRHLLWYDPENVAGPREAGLPLDKYFRTSEVATFRSAWEDPNAVFAGFKAGDNETSHSDTDLGAFMLDALDTRWAVELGSDDYNMPGYFDTGAAGQRWTYYRKRAEGQNTLVVNPGGGTDQNPLAAGEIVRQESGAAAAFAVADLTKAYAREGVTSWRRGVSLLDHRRQMLVQDELTADGPVDAWWFMHTGADIEVSPDGRTATLSNGDERLLARILAPAEDATFVAMDAAPLWSSPDPVEQSTNSGVRKLAIRLSDVEDLGLSVLLAPLRAGQEPDPDLPDIEPLADWAVPHAQAPELSGIEVDGEPLEAFSADTFTYDLEVPEDSAAPTVEATAEAGVRVVVHQAQSVPGTAQIEVIEPGGPRSRYEVHFRPPAAAARVIASADDGNVPENTIDGDLGTRWSAQGDGQWIRYDLGEPTTVQGVAIAWYQGDARSAFFDIEVSDDGETWTQVFSGSSSGDTLELEEYPIEETTARYVRIVGHGNSASAWNSITELRVLHPGGEWPVIETPPPTLDGVRLSADPERLVLGETAQLDLTGVLSDGTEVALEDATITYVSSDEQVARVSPDGLVEGVSEGTARLSGIVTTDDRRLLYDGLTMTVDDPFTVTLQPVADAHVNDGARADTNFGSATSMLVKKVQAVDSGFSREAFLAFDLADVEGQIESATLHVFSAVRDSGGTEIDLHFHGVGDGWEEGTLTWNNRPAAGERVATVHVDDVFQWRPVDVTPYVAEQVAGDGRASLVVLQDPPEGTNGLATQIRSRENAEFSPYLVVKLAQQ